jgi:hypothetical protein
MIIPALIIAGVILTVIGVAICALVFARVPEGNEDGKGFHYDETCTASDRYYLAKPRKARISESKSLKRQIPAA